MQTTGGSSFDPEHPHASVIRMIREGVEGDGLEQALDGDGKYLNDVANRLLGWDGRGSGHQLCAGLRRATDPERTAQL